MMVARYIKKPLEIEIEAIQFDGNNYKEIENFIGAEMFYDMMSNPVIKTLESNMIVSDGDFVIKGVKGEFYPCKSDIFELTYELKK